MHRSDTAVINSLYKNVTMIMTGNKINYLPNTEQERFHSTQSYRFNITDFDITDFEWTNYDLIK